MYSKIAPYVPDAVKKRMRLIGAFSVIAACVAAFIKIAGEVVEGGTRGFDEAILLSLRTPDALDKPIGPWWLEVLVSDFTAMGSAAVLVFMSVAVGGYFLLSHRPMRAVLVLGSFAGAQVMNNLLKLGFARPRPSVVSHLGDVHTLSFPSGHAMLSAVIYLTLGMLLSSAQPQRPVRIYIMGVAVLMTALIGLSRIYLGVHYPTDVLAGWAAGVAWACLCGLLVMAYENRATGKTIR